MCWHLLGYFPKRRAERATWESQYPEYAAVGFPAPAPVQEICSVSSCLAKDPPVPEDRVVYFNLYGGYESLALLWQHVPAAEHSRYTVFAYRLADVLFRAGRAERIEPEEVWFPIEPLPAEFECLGYDAVELRHGHCFGCSPLSCNGATVNVNLNRSCLVDTQAEAFRLAQKFGIWRPEPGPYCVVEVWGAARGRLEPASR